MWERVKAFYLNHGIVHLEITKQQENLQKEENYLQREYLIKSEYLSYLVSNIISYASQVIENWLLLQAKIDEIVRYIFKLKNRHRR